MQMEVQKTLHEQIEVKKIEKQVEKVQMPYRVYRYTGLLASMKEANESQYCMAWQTPWKKFYCNVTKKNIFINLGSATNC